MKNIKLTIEYDGKMYHGWQVQKNAVTVQQKLSEAIYHLTKEHVNLIGSSRTDEGVHAYGQVANFVTNSNIQGERFAHAINAFLPPDIVVVKSEDVPLDFHARYNTTGKRYRYIIYNRRIKSALWKDRAYHVRNEIDIDIMKEAAKYLVGTHDFSSFRASGSSTKTSIRTIHDISIDKKGDLITIDVSGDGFLYNMVRIIAGTLVEMGVGHIEPFKMEDIINAKDRKKAGKTAPPQGLYLMEVYY